MNPSNFRKFNRRKTTFSSHELSRLALKALKRLSEALNCHDRALALHPKHVLNLQNKAVLLHQLGKYDEAIAYDERALQLDPDNAGLWKNKAIHLESLGRTEAAELCMRQAYLVQTKGT